MGGQSGTAGWAGPGTHANVLGPEEELTAEVGALNVVHICDSHSPAGPGPQAQQGEAFEQFAADSTGTHLPAEAASARGPGWALDRRSQPHHTAHQEEALMAQLLLETSPKHRDLPVVAAAPLGDRDRGQWWPRSIPLS